jgi:hypothetical protein
MDGFNLETSLSRTHPQNQNDGEKSQGNEKQSDEESFEEYVKHQSDFDYTGDEDYLYNSITVTSTEFVMDSVLLVRLRREGLC